MPTAPINGHHLYYETIGQGPPLLYIHGGFGGLGTTVAPRDHAWARALTDAYTFIHYDRRSSGRSDFPAADYDIATLAADARELLRHLEVERAVVMGDSAGGPVALVFALAYPDAIRGLVLAETGARLLGGQFAERIRARVELLRREGPEAAYEARRQEGGVGLGERERWFTLPPEHTERLAREQQAVLECLRATTRAERVRWYAGELRNYAAYLDLDLDPRLGEVHCPTLVLHGNSDNLIPYELGRRLAKGIAGAELVAIPGADHGVMYFPGAAAALRAWLDRRVGSHASC